MFTRIILTGLVLVALMVGIKDHRVLHITGLTGSCSVMQTAPDGTEVDACRAGKLEGMPSLSGQGCTDLGSAVGQEYWKCPAPISP